MKILLQIGIVSGLYWVSQCIELLLPIPFPASVISLLVLLVLLLVRALKVEHIRETADLLLGNLTFFFIPVAVSIVNYLELIQRYAAAFVVICILSTVATFGATAAAVHLTIRLMERKGAHRA